VSRIPPRHAPAPPRPTSADLASHGEVKCAAVGADGAFARPLAPGRTKSAPRRPTARSPAARAIAASWRPRTRQRWEFL